VLDLSGNRLELRDSSHAIEEMRVGSGGFTPLHSIIWAANQQGIFKTYGFGVAYLALTAAF